MLMALATRPQTYVQLLKRSLNLTVASFTRAFALALLVSFVVFIPRLVSMVKGQSLYLLLTQSHSSYQSLILVVYLAALWFLAATLWRVHCVERRMHDTYIKDFNVACHKILKILTVAGIIFAIAFVGSVLVWALNYSVFHSLAEVQPSVFRALMIMVIMIIDFVISSYAFLLFFFFFPLMVTENDGVVKSLSDSAHLVWNNSWRILVLQMTPWLAYLILIALLRPTLGLNLHPYFSPVTPATSYCATLIHCGLFAGFILWSLACILVQLRDLEIRKPLRKKRVKLKDLPAIKAKLKAKALIKAKIKAKVKGFKKKR